MGLRKNTPSPGGEHLPPRSLGEVLAELEHSDADVRRRAALELAGYHEAVGHLVERIAFEEDRAVRETLFTSAARFDDPATARRLSAFLRSEDASMRTATVDVLAQMIVGTPAILAELVEDSDPDVRALAVMIMSSLSHPSVPGRLAWIVEHDTHANVVAAALTELAEVGDESHTPLVRAAVARFPDDGFLRFCAETAEASIVERHP